MFLTAKMNEPKDILFSCQDRITDVTVDVQGTGRMHDDA